MQAGKPVVVSDCGPLSELGDEADGVLRVPPSAAAVADTLSHLSPALGALGQIAVAQRYSAVRMAAEYTDLYAETR
jgi:glycosyltransferase involved in cell wall biosynthesis